MARYVRGLPVPELLLDLLSSGRWQHPGDDTLRAAVPYISDPIDFLSNIEQMEFESGSLSLPKDTWMHEFHGNMAAEDRPLPWLDADRSFFVAVNARIGDDVGIALDFRTSMNDPSVVASDWTEDGCCWRRCADTFTEFVARLRL